MVSRKADTPAEYLDMIEGRQREIIEAIRRVIFEAIPGQQETTGCGMLDYPGLANLGAQKQYVSLYVKPSVLELHKGNFPGTNCGRSCLRFTRLEQVDPEHLADLLRAVAVARRQ